MTILSSETLHASCVAIDGVAVLIEGPSGSGKSDLALRLVDRGGTLVSDDYTIVRRDGRGAVANAPATIAGRIEVRGVGLIAMPFATDVPVALIVAISDAVARLPEEGTSRAVAGVSIPLLSLSALEASAPIKIELMLRQVRAT